MRPPNTLKNEFKYWEITKDIIDQIIEESQLDPESIYIGIKKFAKARLSRSNNI